MKKKLILLVASMAFIACAKKTFNETAVYGQWNIETVQGLSTEEGEETPFIHFGEAGEVNGNTSINSFFGEYALNGTQLSLNNIGMTRRMGASMEIENAITEVLADSVNIQIENDTLMTLLNKEGAIVMTLIKEK